MSSNTIAPSTKLKSVQPAAYPASWVDRLSDRIKKLPVPVWATFLCVALALVLIRSVIGWIDNSYPVGTFFKIHILDGFTTFYLLVILYYMDERTTAALAIFRPVLTVDAEGYEALRYQTTTMPARVTLIVGLVGLIFGLAYLPMFDTEADLLAAKYFTSPAATFYDIAVTGIQWTINFVFIYHTIRQLRLVSQIYTRHTRVSIFDTGPLYALSRVTSATTVAMLVLIYVYVAFYGDWQVGDNTTNLIVGGTSVVLALVTFVWPLFGAHRLLQDEKERRKGDIARRIEATADALHLKADAGDYANIGDLNHTIEGLTREQAIVSKASTWPWDPEALRAVVTALLLPVIIWVITRLLERFGV